MPLNVAPATPALKVTSMYGRVLKVAMPMLAPFSGLASRTLGTGAGVAPPKTVWAIENVCVEAAFTLPWASANEPGRNVTVIVLYGSFAPPAAVNVPVNV